MDSSDLGVVHPDLLAALVFSIASSCTEAALLGIGQEISGLDLCHHDREILRAAYKIHLDFLRSRMHGRS